MPWATEQSCWRKEKQQWSQNPTVKKDCDAKLSFNEQLEFCFGLQLLHRFLQEYSFAVASNY